MKIAIAFCAHKRNDLTRLCIEHLNTLKQQFDIEIVVCSTIGEKYENCHNIEAKNFPVSQKHNTLFEFCKTLKVDGIILIGSDDFLSKERLEWYFETCKKGTQSLINVNNVHFYSTKTKELGFYNVEKPQLGGGRFFSKWVLDKLDWKPWGELEINKGLDTKSGIYMEKMGIKSKTLEPLGMFLGVHHTINTSSDARLIMSEKVDNKLIEQEFGEIGTKILELERPPIADPKNFEGVRTIRTTSKSHSGAGKTKEVEAYTAYLLVRSGRAIYID